MDGNDNLVKKYTEILRAIGKKNSTTKRAVVLVFTCIRVFLAEINI